MSLPGDFVKICETVALTVCPLVGRPEGIEPECYSRNVEIAGTLIFQPATIIIHVIALVMTSIMIYHIKSKYTAVGRKEIVMFFYLYMMVTFIELLLVSGIVPAASDYFVAGHIGLITATFWCLLLNGFVGFQFAEDGTPLSLWSIRISSLVVFLAVFGLSIATFKNLAGFTFDHPLALWIVLYIFNGAALAIYFVLQIVLVLNTLDDRWPLGDILFGISFYVIGQVILYLFSVKICDTAKHYIDGLFFGTICTLLGVMMVYKYWDSITKEDLEFSVGSKQNVWEVKELLEDEQAYSNYPPPPLPQGGFTGYQQPQSGYNASYPQQQYGAY
ncbi:5332_t:CDS:2 [Cetraspora pellucida]|uniref:Chitin synthase export chaperone n=1 Tax=Cetraspora pellucida TaxID=1433469 RepID=A0A9N9H0M3_9GLOM|nr:5332_t:CDS:2 [Cetraspora pellucida]